MTALQQDSERRIREYQTLKEEAQKRGDAKNARSWAKELADEKRNLEMIKRVDRINALGILEVHSAR
jgi:hypothetical protein